MSDLKNTQSLIHDLAHNVEPVQVLEKPQKRLIKLMVIFFGLFIVAGIAEGLHNVNGLTLGFIVEVALILTTFFFSVLAALWQNVPGLNKTSMMKWPVLIFVLWVSFLLGYLMYGQMGISKENVYMNFHCPLVIVGVGSLGVFFMIREIKRGAILNRNKIIFLILLASFTFAALVPQFYCPHQEAEHLLTMHLLPVVFMVITGFYLLRKILFIQESKRK